MKVVLARQRIGERFGGAEGYVSMLARAMRDGGADVHLMAQAVSADLDREKFPVIRVPSSSINLWGVSAFARAVGRYAKEHPDTPLISFDRTPGAKFVRAGDGCHRTYLESMGQTFSARFSIKHQTLLSLEKRTFTHPELRLVFVNSKMVGADLQSRYGLPEDRIRVVYTGVPPLAPPSTDRPAARSKWNLPLNFRVMLFAGHHYERKNLETLLWALRIVDVQSNPPADGMKRKSGRKRNWILLVAGRGNISKYKAMADWLGIGDSVRFLGECDLKELFVAADVFVLPTRYDPLARVCLEAAQAGLPVVTTAANGFSEWIREGAGFVAARADDPAELAEILRRAFTLNLADMGNRLRGRVQSLTIEKNAGEILNHVSPDNPAGAT